MRIRGIEVRQKDGMWQLHNGLFFVGKYKTIYELKTAVDRRIESLANRTKPDYGLDANREMIGGDADFGLGDIGNK